MKLSKLFKIALPILGVATIATTVPLALTSCSSQTTSESNPSKPGQSQQQVQVLEPVDINSLPIPTHNFKNSFTQQPTSITSLADANKQLQEKWNQMSESQKSSAVKDDLENMNLFFNGYQTSSTTFTNVTEDSSKTLNHYIDLPNDPNGEVTIPTTYKYRFFSTGTINNISFSNNKLNFDLIYNYIYQIANEGNVIAQFDYQFVNNYSNATIVPMLIQDGNSQNKYISSYVLEDYHLDFSTKVVNIIANNNTPIDEYFKEHINSTVWGMNKYNGAGSSMKLLPSFSENINFTNLINENLSATNSYQTYTTANEFKNTYIMPKIWNGASFGWELYNYNGTNPNAQLNPYGSYMVNSSASPVFFPACSLDCSYTLQSNISSATTQNK